MDEGQHTADDVFGGRVDIAEGLKRLRLRLLDLTTRNRLLNFRHSAARTVRIVAPALQPTYERLTGGLSIAFTPVPEPKPIHYERPADGPPRKPRAEDFARVIGFPTQFDEAARPEQAPALRVLFYPDDLERVMRRVASEARTAIEETGSNFLHLIFSFLEYTESDDSEKKLLAPLVAVPVTLTRGNLDQSTRTYRYELNFSGEDITDNLSLREKLNQDFRLHLPEFDANEDKSLDQYLREVARAVRHKQGWAVRRFLTLAPLSFGKMLLVIDLDPRRWPVERDGRNRLLDHEVVRMVFEGRPRPDGLAGAPEYELDDHPEERLPLIADADSSQHSALIDALAGRNMVVEGPPGTGKSQTITNLIAAAMQRGKKVLFVSEKVAALEVVKQRLELAGLGEFCLELHGTKTSKQKVLDAIRRRLNRRFRAPVDLEGKLHSLEQQKRSLTQYAALMRSRIGNAMGLTVHDIVWASERHRLALGPEAASVAGLEFAHPEALTRSDLDRLAGLGSTVGRQLSVIGEFGDSNPWWGFYPTRYAPGDDLAIGQLLEALHGGLLAVMQGQQAFCVCVGAPELRLDPASTEKLRQGLGRIDANGVHGALVERIFGSHDEQGQLDAISAWSATVDQARELNRQAAKHIHATGRIDGDAGARYNAAYRAAESRGLHRLTIEQARSRSREWREVAGHLDAVNRTYEAIAGAGALPFSGCVRDVFVLTSVVDLAADAPRDLLAYRTDTLATDEAALLTEQLKRQHSRLTAMRQELDSTLYLDMPVSVGELVKAIRTLRQGDAWYRVFQSEWRAAVRLHRSLSRGPKRRKAAERCAELERLASYLQAREEFVNHPRYGPVFGPLFEAEKTNTTRIERLVRWLVSSRAQLARLHIPARVLNVASVSEAVLADIAAFKDEAHRYRDLVGRARQWFAPGDGSPDEGAITADQIPLVEFASMLAKHAQVLADCVQAAGDVARPASTLESIRTALEQATVAQRLFDAAANDARVATLLGSYFNGVDSDLRPVARAKEYATQLVEAGVAEPVRHRLTRADLAEALASLANLSDALALRWREVATIEGELKRHADIQIEQWARVPVSNSSFASSWAKQVQACRAAIQQLPEWARYVSLRREASEAGLGDIVSALEGGQLSADRGGLAVHYRVFASLAQELYRRHPELRRYGAAQLDTLRSEFARLDREIISVRGQALAKEISSRAKPPGGTTGARVDEKTDMALIEHLLPQVRPRVAVRQTLYRAGRAVQELMPCFMMGPQSVAQYLAPGVMHFDLVVMDEASQLKPEEAIGAIARGHQLVVVGDPKQLPPTNFFDRYDTVDDDGEAAFAAADVPSILDVCMGHFSPVRRLKWHYRSRHESLIAFSNHHFYDNDLIVFPSPYPRGAGLGVKYHYVGNGVYDSQMNKPEALAVANAVMDHILRRPDDSLGIVTLNLKQRDLIEELLEQRFKDFPQAEAFKARWEAERLPLFVKNLENVQGDERDTVFISTTFGPAPGTGVVRQNFGPISRDNGWRRLNVLFTRARRAVHVFSSMQPGDIVVDANTRGGTRAFANYLHYAQTGVLAAPDDLGASAESDFEVAVKLVLQGAGYEVVPQLGVAGFRIDLAVRHPERPKLFMAAVECDGASYHTGKSVRDRDRIRQEILESLGWKNRIHRIWSTDWFESPARQTQRLLAFLEAAKSMPFSEQLLEAEVEPEKSEVAPADRQAVPPELANEAARFVHDEATDIADLVVEAGDTVTYAVASQANEAQTIQIREDLRDFEHGVIPVGVPLAQALLGAGAGDVVSLRVPGRPAQELTILRIVKPDGRIVSLR